MQVQLTFKQPGYIADPYRIARFRLIEIQKQSGMMRARSEKKRRECLETYLRSTRMELAEYEALEKEANIPFYYNKDGFIVIPNQSVYACLANANDEAPSRLRIQNLRVELQVSDFTTDKKEPDGVFERFAVVKSGTGKTLSNQRGFRSNAYIRDFTASGTIDCDPKLVRPDSIIELLTFAGRSIGIGASRKLGYGRFTVAQS